MNVLFFFFFFFFLTFGGLVVGEGGRGHGEFAPPHFLPNPIHIYLYGCGD